VLVSVIAQQTVRDSLQFHVRHTRVDVTDLLVSALALVLLAATLLALLRKSARFYRTCPECLSDIPHDATVCRYCTADLARSEAS
jgi:ribosomal protein L40E